MTWMKHKNNNKSIVKLLKYFQRIFSYVLSLLLQKRLPIYVFIFVWCQKSFRTVHMHFEIRTSSVAALVLHNKNTLIFSLFTLLFLCYKMILCSFLLVGRKREEKSIWHKRFYDWEKCLHIKDKLNTISLTSHLE